MVKPKPKTTKKPELDNLVQSIGNLAKVQKDLARQVYDSYKDEVDHIIISQSRDQNRIDHALDGLLNFAFDDKVLVLFKKLCRYNFTFDPQTTTSYIYSYRDMWDEEYQEAQEAEKQTNKINNLKPQKKKPPK